MRAYPSTVFIYDGPGSDPICRKDAYELFEAHGIFERPNVCFSNFQHIRNQRLNPSETLMVYPGGTAMAMGDDEYNASVEARELFSQGAHGAGFCAGGFYIPDEHRLYSATHRVIDVMRDDELTSTLSPPQNSAGNSQYFNSLKLCEDYAAIGPFYPDPEYYLSRLHQNDPDCTPKTLLNAGNRKPYVTSLTFNNNSVLNAIYVGGPAFIPKTEGTTQVVAHYPERDYLFHDKVSPVDPTISQHTFRLPAAIISRRPYPTTGRGGLFLSGPHVEACVPNSGIHRFFTTRGAGRISLSDEKIALLERDRSEMLETVVQHFNETFRFTP